MGTPIFNKQFRAAVRYTLLLATLLLAAAGCQPTESTKQDANLTRPSGPVRVLVVDDRPLADAIAREWAARAEGEMVVSNATSAEVLGKPVEVDAIVYPSGLLGELAVKKIIAPLPPYVATSDRFALKNVFPLVRIHATTWGKEIYAVPFGSPQFVLLYRKDLLDAHSLTPPETWHDYLYVARQLDGGKSPAEETDATTATWYTLVEPLGDGWASQVLLARAAAYARHRSQYSTLFDFSTMEPRIDGKPFVRALTELVEAARLGPPDATQLTPYDARRLLFEGRCAMAMTWLGADPPAPTGETDEASVDADPVVESDAPTDAATDKTNKAPVDVDPVAETETESTTPDVSAMSRSNIEPTLAVAPLPGSMDVFAQADNRWEERRPNESSRVPLLCLAGRLGSVTASTPRRREAAAALEWLSGPKLSPLVAPHSAATTLYRTSHLREPKVWAGSGVDAKTARQYADVVAHLEQEGAYLATVRIPGRAEYLAALDRAVQAAVRGEQTPAEALQEAAAQWREITARLGIEQQRQAYRRSLGLED